MKKKVQNGGTRMIIEKGICASAHSKLKLTAEDKDGICIFFFDLFLSES
jgi:hypothetical protein